MNTPVAPRRVPVLYTTGYLGQGTISGKNKIATFDEMVRRAGLFVVDIRLNPWSKAPCWRKEDFCRRLGSMMTFPDGLYLHVPALGNVHYNTDKPIKIANVDFGLAWVLEHADACGRDPLLLCGCGDPEWCHRFTVGCAFAGRAQRWYEVTRWDNPQNTPQKGPADSVFGDDFSHYWNLPEPPQWSLPESADEPEVLRAGTKRRQASAL